MNILWRDFKDFKKIYYSEEEQSNYNNSEFVNKMKFLNDEFGISRNLPSKSIPNLKKFSENKISTAFDTYNTKEQEPEQDQEEDDDLGVKKNSYQMKNENDKEVDSVTEDPEIVVNKDEELAYTNQNDNNEQKHKENTSSSEEPTDTKIEENENSEDKTDETNNEEIQDEENK